MIGNYQLKQVLKKGSLGKSWVIELNGTKYVAKQLQRSEIEQQSSRGRRYVQLLKSMQLSKGDHLIRFVAEERDENNNYLIVEYVQNNLENEIKARTAGFRLEQAVLIIASVLRGLQQLRMSGLYHLNLKPTNVLISKDQGRMKARLCDFSMLLPDDNLANLASSNHLSPEFFTPEERKWDAIDVWSVGVLLYQMLNGELPFDYKKESVDKVAQRCENYSYRKGAKNEESATPKVEQLFKNIFIAEPTMRINAHKLKLLINEIIPDTFSKQEIKESDAVYRRGFAPAFDMGSSVNSEVGSRGLLGLVSEMLQSKPNMPDPKMFPNPQSTQKKEPPIQPPNQPAVAQRASIPSQSTVQKLQPASQPTRISLPNEQPPTNTQQPPRPFEKKPEPQTQVIASRPPQRPVVQRLGTLPFFPQARVVETYPPQVDEVHKLYSFDYERNRFLSETSELVMSPTGNYFPEYLKCALAYMTLKLFIVYQRDFKIRCTNRMRPDHALEEIDWNAYFHSSNFRKMMQNVDEQIAKAMERLRKLYEDCMTHLEKLQSKIPNFKEALTKEINETEFKDTWKMVYRNVTNLSYAALDKLYHKLSVQPKSAATDQQLCEVYSLLMKVFICHSINQMFRQKLIPELYEQYFRWLSFNKKGNEFDFESFRIWLGSQSVDNLRTVSERVKRKIFSTQESPSKK